MNKFVDASLKHLQERFSFIEKIPFSDFCVMDVKNVPLHPTDLATYGNVEIGNLVNHFQGILSQEEIPQQWSELKAKLKQNRRKNTQEVLAQLEVKNLKILTIC